MDFCVVFSSAHVLLNKLKAFKWFNLFSLKVTFPKHFDAVSTAKIQFAFESVCDQS